MTKTAEIFSFKLSLSIQILIVIATFVALQESIIGSNATKQSEEEANCTSTLIQSVKKTMQEVAKCTKALGLKTKQEKKEKSACVMKCAAINIGMLAEDGTIDEMLAMAFIYENVPEKYHEKAVSIMMTCVRHVDNLDPKDPTCKSYEPIFKCAADNAAQFAKLCTSGSDSKP